MAPNNVLMLLIFLNSALDCLNETFTAILPFTNKLFDIFDSNAFCIIQAFFEYVPEIHLLICLTLKVAILKFWLRVSGKASPVRGTEESPT